MENIIRSAVAVESFAYPDGTQALSGIDLEVRKGEFIGLLGSNGSGKTTLLKIMDGLIKDFKGTVLLDGSDVRKLSPRDIYKKVGLVFQNVAIGPNNMGFADEEVSRRVMVELKDVEMEVAARKSIHKLRKKKKKR